MRKLLLTAVVAMSLTVVSLSVTMSARADSDGFCCTNACPLAKQANTRHAAGSEALLASETIRREAVDDLLGNLKRI